MKHLLLLLFLLSFSVLFSQEKSLFSIDNIQLANFKKDQFSKDALEYKVVAVNLDFINQKTIEIPLFENTFIAQIKKTYNAPIGTQTWVGNLKDENNSSVLFTINKSTFFGKIVTETGKVYIIKSIKRTNLYVVLKLNNKAFKSECGLSNNQIKNQVLKNSYQNNKNTNSLNVCDITETCNQTNVDIAVFYTNGAMEDLGGQASAEAAIATSVAEINMINANSNVAHTMTLVYTGLTQLTESNNQSLSGINSKMKDPNDGIMDEIPVLRDQYYADLVALITLKGSSAGSGNVNTDPDEFNPQQAYSSTKSSAMISQYTLAHETGHNLGLRHDRYAYTNNGDSLPNVVCDFAWGWVNANANSSNPNSQWRTVMAYNAKCEDNGYDCERISYFSNPDLSYNGDPLGAVIGTSNEANNASILNRSYCKVADFRTPPCLDCEVVYNGGCEDYNPNSASGSGNTTNIVIAQNFAPVPNSGSVILYVTYTGDNKNILEQFNILDENNTKIGETNQLINDCDSNRIEINIPVSDFNNWISDGIVTIKLDPQNTNINPSYCDSGNYACVEFGVFSEPLNVNDYEIKNTISIYPNPTSNSFEIKSNITISNIKIYNNLGQFLLESNKKAISLVNFPKGLYFIKVTSETNRIYNAKIIKK